MISLYPDHPGDPVQKKKIPRRSREKGMSRSYIAGSNRNGRLQASKKKGYPFLHFATPEDGHGFLKKSVTSNER